MPESKYEENKAKVLTWLAANPGYHTFQEIGIGCGFTKGAAMWASRLCWKINAVGIGMFDANGAFKA